MSLFHLAGKVVWLLATPSNALIFLGLIGIAALRSRRENWRRWGRTIMVATISALAVLGLTPLPAFALSILEQRFSPLPASTSIDGIILLGGGLNHCRAGGCPDELNDAGQRLLTAADLARQYPDATVIVSGGPKEADGSSEARVSAAMLQAMGVSADRIRIEDRSLSTAENARFTAALIAGARTERWALVTSAFHMPRAMGAFRKAGVHVIAAPCNYRTYRRPGFLAFRASDALAITDVAAKEYFGLVAYYLSGRTAAILPEP
jgi:uncharacterized SAM-binding protein YcdF (DUF218 family)